MNGTGSTLCLKSLPYPIRRPKKRTYLYKSLSPELEGFRDGRSVREPHKSRQAAAI